jgi:membrane protein DedA with SNARE-associated domain
MGGKIGDHGLEHWVPAKRLAQIRARVRKKGAVALAVLDLVPPPFPFTPFVLAAGALEVKPRTFFVTLTVCRILRFGLEAALALVYGDRIMAWFESDLFHQIVMFFMVLAIALTALSLVQVIRATRAPARKRAVV